MRARRIWGWPLVPLYAAALAVKDGLRRMGVLRTRTLEWPVVSVGSLSAGGAGKTPVVIALAELLRERGWSVDVLSRGYGREGMGVERVDLEAVDAARRFGDEPVMIARRAGLSVWVGAERFAAGDAAERYGFDGQKADSSALRNDKEVALRDDERVALRDDEQRVLRDGGQMRLHLLDDGFQHRGLARAIDVVLVTEADLKDALLPAGNRRERLTALGRADVVVLREDEKEQVEVRVRGLMREGAAVWSVRRQLRFAVAGGEPGAGSIRFDSANVFSSPGQCPSRLVVFCAIARPEGFLAMLRQAGCGVVKTVEFDDHHAYTAADVDRLVIIAGNCGATGFVTTEKDAVKLSEAMVERLRAVGPVCVAGLDAKFVDEVNVVRELEARLR